MPIHMLAIMVVATTLIQSNIKITRHFASEVSRKPELCFLHLYPSTLRSCNQMLYQGVLRSSPNQHCFHLTEYALLAQNSIPVVFLSSKVRWKYLPIIDYPCPHRKTRDGPTVLEDP